MLKLFSKYVVFCLVGAVSSTIDVSILYVLVEFFAVPLYVAATLAIVCSSINGFILNKILTFKNNSRNIYQQYAFYFLVCLGGLGFTLFFLWLFTEHAGLHYLVAKLITIVIVTLWNFNINNFFVFKNPVQS